MHVEKTKYSEGVKLRMQSTFLLPQMYLQSGDNSPDLNGGSTQFPRARDISAPPSSTPVCRVPFCFPCCLVAVTSLSGFGFPLQAGGARQGRGLHPHAHPYVPAAPARPRAAAGGGNAGSWAAVAGQPSPSQAQQVLSQATGYWSSLHCVFFVHGGRRGCWFLLASGIC
ncbi:hypothetical protein SEVIR_2G171250v4 [Setaria viridis]